MSIADIESIDVKRFDSGETKKLTIGILVIFIIAIIDGLSDFPFSPG